jgi:hypothetical protein
MPTDGHWDAIREHETYTRAQTDPDVTPQQPQPVLPLSPTSEPPALIEFDSPSPAPPVPEVELILAVAYRRTHNRHALELIYRVLWVGCSIHDTTWEPLSNLVADWEAVLEAHSFFGLPPPEHPHADLLIEA